MRLATFSTLATATATATCDAMRLRLRLAMRLATATSGCDFPTNPATRSEVPDHLIRLSTGPYSLVVRSDMFHMGFKGLSVLVWKVLGPSRRFIAIFFDFLTSLWTTSSSLDVFAIHLDTTL